MQCGNAGKTPRILNPDSRWWCRDSFMRMTLCKKSLVHIGQEPVWVPETVWALDNRKPSFSYDKPT
jgi:hypothetical protein